jgi:hypothetical protein
MNICSWLGTDRTNTHLIYIPVAFQKKKQTATVKRVICIQNTPKAPGPTSGCLPESPGEQPRIYATVQVMPEESRSLATKGMASWELNSSCMLSYRTKQCMTKARKFDKAVQCKIACSSSSTTDARHLSHMYRQLVLNSGEHFSVTTRNPWLPNQKRAYL